MPLTINYVWFGDKALGPLERFNIYSWRAMGADVTVYACKWDTSAHSASSLGLKDVKVVDLYGYVTKDKNPNVPKTRELLTAWLDAAKATPPRAVCDHVFNVVDLSKSYICSTQLGIVLDLKVGPSPHVAAYQDCLEKKFVSYTRADQTATSPENQCMGTMTAAVRDKYAKRFEQVVTAKFLDVDPFPTNKSTPTAAHFDKITGWHGKSATVAQFVDTAKLGPNGGAPPKGTGNLSIYRVDEIGGSGHGPFRVFKRAKDQTNKPSSVPTTKEDVFKLATMAWEKEFSKLLTVENATVSQRKFLREVEEALKVLPKK
jgi:hypothetical protein